MHCKHCGFVNSEDDHRCLRCGRRIGSAVAAPAELPLETMGATALAPNPLLQMESATISDATMNNEDEGQGGLFGPKEPKPRLTQKVIPFTEIQRQAGVKPADARPVMITPPVANTSRTGRPAQRRAARPPVEQEAFPFMPADPVRELSDSVEAQVYCDLPVATPTHRLMAGLIDTSLILLGFGVFMGLAFGTGRFMGVSHVFGQGKVLWSLLAASLGAIAMFYGFIWVSSGRESAGMRWCDLQIVTFDGFPPDGGNRAARFAATVLSFCSGGVGLFWALGDAENLTWHDQISRTFPTVRTGQGSFVQQRRR